MMCGNSNIKFIVVSLWMTCVCIYIYIYIYICTHIYEGKVLPQKAEMARGFPGRLRHYEGGSSSALRTGRLFPRRNPWYSFLEVASTPGHMVLSVATEKIPNDTTGNRSRDRPTSSAAP